MTSRAYFDWNATAPLADVARAAMVATLGATGNASSVHAEGRAARSLIEKARAQVAALVGAEPKNVTFTSGGTEANALALTPALETRSERTPRDKLFVSAIEHPSVRSGGRFAEFVELPVDENGRVQLAPLPQLLSGAERPLVSVMLANNETGVIQPIAEIAEVVHAANGVLHVDAVQGPGRIACDIETLGADLMTISAHKIGGPQGVGALIRQSAVFGDIHIAMPLIRGGGQERNIRAGTENVAAIAGFGAAAAALQNDGSRLAKMRDEIETELRKITPDIVVFGAQVTRLPNTSLFALPGAKAETAIIAFDLNGVAVSSGSACSSGKVQPSHVLAAMGVPPELAKGAIRLSIGPTTTDNDVGMLLSAWRKIAPGLSKGRGIAA
ncbi:MAG TPA: cysteine desulfurase family protein [Pseudolabrys sp.]|nr:cysteine desulfurase family protein [Pseudolabrys sp.]